MATLFDAVMASEAGRIQPVNAAPVDGSWVLCLGADKPGHRGMFKANDYVGVAPTDAPVAVAGAMTTSPIRVRGAAQVLPPGWEWRFQLVDYTTRNIYWLSFPIPAGMDIIVPAVGLFYTSPIALDSLQWRLILSGPANEVIEAEVPAVYVDALTTGTVNNPVVFNVYPAPAQRKVPRRTTIWLTITDDAAIATPAADFPYQSIDVFVDDVKVVSAGVAIGGWTIFTDPPVGAVVMRLTPPTDYASDADVVVRVANASIPGARPLAPFQYVWTFHTVDQTAPKLVAAAAAALDTVRVTFDDDMRADTASDPLSALHAEAYTLEGLTVPFYAPTPLAVSPVVGRTYDIVFDAPLTPGARYTIRAYGVTDDEGNPIDSAIGATFTAAAPPTVAGRDFTLYRMFPPVVQDQDQQGEGVLRRYMSVFQEVIDLLLGSVDAWIDLIDVERADVRYVDAMLADLGNPFTFDMTDTERRILLLDLIPLLKLRGTDPGIISAVGLLANVPIVVGSAEVLGSLLGGGDLLDDDFVLGADPQQGTYSFSVTSSIVLTPAQRDRVTEIVRRMKPRHTHFVRIYEPTDTGGGSGLLDETTLDGDLSLN